MDNLNKSLGKVSIGVPSKPSVFTFVPVVRKLPIENIISVEETSGTLTGKPNQKVAASHEETTRDVMSDREIFKVFIKAEGGAGSPGIQPGTELQSKPDHLSLSRTKASPSVGAQSENTADHAAAGTASMETAVDKHWGVTQWRRRDSPGLAKVSSDFFANRTSVSEDRTSPTNTADLFPTPASSRESILSEGSDKEKSWSAAQLSSLTSPVPFSRTVSPCSSVRSGAFSPAVVQMKKHFLAPGSTLVHTPQTCFSSCESLSSPVCPRSPPPRHRPPLTRLSLLTAILRKGRLPILSSALQRPYTPCWPVNPVTLSFCNACSAASSVASIPLEFSSRFSSTASIDSQSHVQREPSRCVTSPSPVQSSEHGRTRPRTQAQRCSEQIPLSCAPRLEQAISPRAASGSSTVPRAPLPVFCSNFKSLSPPKPEEIDCATSKKLHHTYISISKPPELKQSNTHMYLKGRADNNLRNLISPSPKVNNEQETPVSQTWSSPPDSPLSRLHLLSQQLRTPPVCLPQSQPDTSRSPTGTASPPPPLPNTSERREAGRTCPDSKSATKSEGFRKAHCLSPSRYTPAVFSGWLSRTGSCTPTPSPAPPVRDLTPSPSLSLRSTPSPRPGSGISDCSDKEGKKRKTHKIKLSYKSLAAIPTNTLLLDQQAIDEQVEREGSPCDTLGVGVADTHAEMRSPSQLRQESAELYAVIDEVLASSIPECKTSRSLQPPRSSTTKVGLQQNNSTFPKSLGRETKYASLSSLLPSTSVERKLMDSKKTKPGVIRPMTAIPRLTVEDEEEFHPNPFRQFNVKHTFTDNKKVENKSLEEAGKECNTSSKGQRLRGKTTPERRSPLSVCDLQITEPEDRISHPVKDASTSFSHTEGRMETSETHI